MKTMTIEKQFIVSRNVKQMYDIEVKDHLVYRKEESGIRAIGQLFIQGAYEDVQGTMHKLQEVLEMDVLAPWEKLEETQFSIQIQEAHASAKEDNIIVYITLEVHGLKEETSQTASKQVPLEEHVEEETPEQIEVEKEVEDLFEDTDTTYTSYRMVVAQPQDTYESIATRYDVDIQELKDRNHHRPIQTKMLVILPMTKA